MALHLLFAAPNRFSQPALDGCVSLPQRLRPTQLDPASADPPYSGCYGGPDGIGSTEREKEWVSEASNGHRSVVTRIHLGMAV